MSDLVGLSNYKEFKCKCDKCRHTCCGFWRINVDKADYNKIHKLKRDVGFLEKEDFYSPKRFAHIKLNEKGYCPLLSDGLCSLQQECGVEALTKVCMAYPRLVRYIRGAEVALSASCEGVTELLLTNELVKEQKYDISLISGLEYTKNQDFICKKRERSKCISILSRTNQNLDTRLFNLGEYLKEFDSSISSDVFMDRRHFNYVKEIYTYLFERRSNMMGYPSFVSNLTYEDVMKKSIDKETELWITNLLINHMFYMNYPYCDNEENYRASFIGLVTIYGILRLVFINPIFDTYEKKVDIISFIFREIEHQAFYSKCLNIYIEMM